MFGGLHVLHKVLQSVIKLRSYVQKTSSFLFYCALQYRYHCILLTACNGVVWYHVERTVTVPLVLGTLHSPIFVTEYFEIHSCFKILSPRVRSRRNSPQVDEKENNFTKL
jgi:hypothetical protein